MPPWLDHFLEIVLKQAETVIGLLDADEMEKPLSPKQLTIRKYLQEVGEAPPREIGRATKVVKTTIVQALDGLAKLEKIERTGMGRGTGYGRL